MAHKISANSINQIGEQLTPSDFFSFLLTGKSIQSKIDQDLWDTKRIQLPILEWKFHPQEVIELAMERHQYRLIELTIILYRPKININLCVSLAMSMKPRKPLMDSLIIDSKIMDSEKQMYHNKILQLLQDSNPKIDLLSYLRQRHHILRRNHLQGRYIIPRLRYLYREVFHLNNPKLGLEPSAEELLDLISKQITNLIQDPKDWRYDLSYSEYNDSLFFKSANQ